MAPTDQRSGVRPITFVPEYQGRLLRPVTLPIRPEDLTVNYPSRMTVHQTLGRETQGWVDSFGAGLPTITIAGHTGWGYKDGLKKDGFESFLDLKGLITPGFANFKDYAVNKGQDPAVAKLIFVDLLDELIWSVAPMQYVLRRSKSRPLLYQYSITLQVVDTRIDNVERFLPNRGSISGGLRALSDVVSRIEDFAAGIVDGIKKAVSFVSGAIASVAAVVSKFVSLTKRVMGAVQSVVSSITNGFSSLANQVVGIAKDISSAGVAIFRTFSAIRNLPATLRAQLGRVAAAFNEMKCIFGNALRPRKVYEDYDGLYGASTCSSTTGGRPASPYSKTNPFALLQPAPAPIVMGSGAIASTNALKASDPVLAPMPIAEIERHTDNVVNGIVVVSL